MSFLAVAEHPEKEDERIARRMRRTDLQQYRLENWRLKRQFAPTLEVS
jgi:hypothetical protein